MIILGLSGALGHDPSAAILVDGQIHLWDNRGARRSGVRPPEGEWGRLQRLADLAAQALTLGVLGGEIAANADALRGIYLDDVVLDEAAELLGRFGLGRAAEAAVRIGGAGRKDTLCYATQVNQDALGRALEQPLDAAFVIGGALAVNLGPVINAVQNTLGIGPYGILFS